MELIVSLLPQGLTNVKLIVSRNRDRKNTTVMHNDALFVFRICGHTSGISSLLDVLIKPLVQVRLMVLCWLILIHYIMTTESFLIRKRRFQDGSIYGTMNLVNKLLLKFFSVFVLHLLGNNARGILLPRNLFPLPVIQVFLLVFVVLQSSLQDKIYGQGDAEDRDGFAKMRFFFDSQSLLQRQSQDCGFLGHTNVTCSGWFGFILEFLYFSLPRPPDHRCDFHSPSPSIHMTFTRRWEVLMSQVMALRIVSYSGGLHNILSFFYGSLPRPPEDQFFSFTPPLFT